MSDDSCIWGPQVCLGAGHAARSKGTGVQIEQTLQGLCLMVPPLRIQRHTTELYVVVRQTGEKGRHAHLQTRCGGCGVVVCCKATPKHARKHLGHLTN